MTDPRPAAPRSKRGRLTRSADFDRVFRKGRSYGDRHMVLHLFPRASDAGADDPDARVGLSVSRRVGNAVQRNRVKRVLREAARVEVPRLPASYDVVLVARPDLEGLVDREGLEGARRSLAGLVDKTIAADASS